jgi:hypothetical protein
MILFSTSEWLIVVIVHLDLWSRWTKKGQKGKQRSKKHYTESKRLSNMNPTKILFESIVCLIIYHLGHDNFSEWNDMSNCRLFSEQASCRNLFPVCQTIGLADVDNVSDLSNICRTYIFFTTSTELHIYWLNP